MAIDSSPRESQTTPRAAPLDPEVLIKEARRQAHRRQAIVGSSVVAMVALAAAAVLIFASGEPGRHRTTPAVPPTNLAGVPICSALAATTQQVLSPVSQEDAFIVVLSNTGSRQCQLSGYPSVRLSSAAGQLLNFKVVHSPLGPWDVTTAAPKPVGLSPRGHGYFQFGALPANCPGWIQATHIGIVPPHSTRRLDLVMPSEPFIAGCRGTSSVSVTPIEPTREDLLGTI